MIQSHRTLRRFTTLFIFTFAILLAASTQVNAQSPNPGSPTDNPTDGAAGAAPAAPSLSGSTSVGQVDLSWSSVADAARYELYAWTEAGGYVNLGSNLTSTSHTHSNLYYGRRHFYWVISYNAD